MKKMITKKLFTAAAFFIMVVLASSAQEKQWTLTECIDYALNENIQVRKAEVSVSVGEISLQQAKDNRWPSLSASLGENLGWQQVTGTNGETSLEGSSRTSASVRLMLGRKELPELEVRNEFLFIKPDYKIRRINFSEIHYIEGLKDYVKIFLNGEKKPVLSLSTLKALEARLPDDKFMRVHRSYIVNLETVRVIERNRIVYGEVRIPVTDQYRENFQRFLDRNFI